MIRLLLLSSTRADFETRRAIDQLTLGLGPAFTIDHRRIGPGADWRNLPHAWWALRRTAPAYDLIHAWDIPSLLAAAVGSSARLLFAPPASAGPRAVRWLSAVHNHRPVHVLCPTATLRRRYIERGLPIDRCHLLRPGVDFARIGRRPQRAALRQQLGLHDTDLAIVLPGESVPAANHRLAVWAASVVRVLEDRYQVLLWNRGPEAPSLVRFTRALVPGRFLHLAAQRHMLEDLLLAADLALITAGDDAPTLPTAITMAAGLPIVSTVCATVSELLEDRHTAAMVAPPAARAIAQRIRDVVSDRALAWSLADRARSEAYEFFSLTRFLTQHRTAYQQLADGDAIDLPSDAPASGIPIGAGSPPGAGSRFHGRA